MSQLLLSISLGYLLGCIQASYLIGRYVKHIDIREHGSTNAGASNATIVMGFKWGLVTFFIDFMKAFAAVSLMRMLYPEDILPAFLAGTFAVLGHIFPFYLGFRGGKGIASLLGMYMAFDWRIGLIITAIQLVISLATDYIAIGSIILYAMLPLLISYFGFPPLIFWATLALTLIGFIKHVPNISKIRKGEEKGVRRVLFKKTN